MKKTIWAALVLAPALVAALAGCGDKEENSVSGGYSYTVPVGWSISDKYTTADKTFYVMDGHEDDETPDNISVEVKSNRYAADEHMQFRDAIVRQLAAQLQGVPATLTGDGTFTDNEDVLYIFTITEDATEEALAADPEAVGVITRQYYIVGDKRYALVQLTNFSGAEEVTAAADCLAKSFFFAPAEE